MVHRELCNCQEVKASSFCQDSRQISAASVTQEEGHRHDIKEKHIKFRDGRGLHIDSMLDGIGACHTVSL